MADQLTLEESLAVIETVPIRNYILQYDRNLRSIDRRGYDLMQGYATLGDFSARINLKRELMLGKWNLYSLEIVSGGTSVIAQYRGSKIKQLFLELERQINSKEEQDEEQQENKRRLEVERETTQYVARARTILNQQR